MRVGRIRTKHHGCPPGVKPIGSRWYYVPTSKQERDERKVNGLPASIPLGAAGSLAARQKWAEVSGYRKAKDAPGTVLELGAIWLAGDGVLKQLNGLKRSGETVAMYRKDWEAVAAHFGHMKYGKTEHEASRGEAIGTVDVQNWIASHPSPSLANRCFAVLDNVFQYAILKGKTTYNPCADAVKNSIPAREREPLPWEVEVLRAIAPPRLGLEMDFEGITGWRISDILRLQNAQVTADGVKLRQKKSGKRQLWEWTPELRRIIEEAAKLPGATPFPASPVFPSRRGAEQSYSAFDSGWQALKRKANALLAQCEIPLRIVDLHFHDLRSKVNDDAEDEGRAGHTMLGNTPAVARKHYRRREQKVRPLR